MGHVACMTGLIDSKVDVNAAKDGVTALMLAAKKGQQCFGDFSSHHDHMKYYSNPRAVVA